MSDNSFLILLVKRFERSVSFDELEERKFEPLMVSLIEVLPLMVSLSNHWNGLQY